MENAEITSASEAMPTSHSLDSLSSAKKILLLGIFCFAQFLDTFNNSALFSSIPPICIALNISNANSVWLLSAYQLTFAAFLLTSGRLSDVFGAKQVFVMGAALMGFMALGAGFVRTEIALITLRAFMGIGAAFNIPSALKLIVGLYPDPAEQSKAVSAFAATSAIGNILGLIIGALFVSFATWPWVFYFIAIAALAVASLAFATIVPEISVYNGKRSKLERLDPVGILTLTGGLVLFVFAVTSGSVNGWKSARVIVNLVLSIVLVIVFFIWEAKIPEEIAALPPSIWKYPDFSVLVATAAFPFLFWGATMLLFSWLWQEVYGWTSLKASVHLLPISIGSLPFAVVGEGLQRHFPRKIIIMGGLLLAVIGCVLLPFADSRENYWRFAFPGLLLGTAGATSVFTVSNIGIFKVTPSSVAGTVGAIYNCILNLGCATGAAVITSIQTTIDAENQSASTFKGRAAGFWFLFAFASTLTISVGVFMNNKDSNFVDVEDALQSSEVEKKQKERDEGGIS